MRAGRLRSAVGHAALATAAIVAACSHRPAGPIRLPHWLASAPATSPILALLQSAGFDGPGVRICRTLSNVGPRPAVIRRFPAEGDGYGEFSMHFFDRDGAWIEPERPAGLSPSFILHPHFIPPPAPTSAEDVSIYAVLAPGEQVENCKRYDLPRGYRRFQAQTFYLPTLDEELIPARLKGDNVIVTRAVGILRSQPCQIDVRRRRTDCAPRP